VTVNADSRRLLGGGWKPGPGFVCVASWCLPVGYKHFRLSRPQEKHKRGAVTIWERFLNSVRAGEGAAAGEQGWFWGGCVVCGGLFFGLIAVSRVPT